MAMEQRGREEEERGGGEKREREIMNLVYNSNLYIIVSF